MGTVSRIDHVAIVVKSIDEVKTFYENALGLRISHIEELPRRGIKTAFIEVGEAKIELIESMHDDSEVAQFLKKRGPGLHHIALKTDDIDKMQEQIKSHDVRLTYEHAQTGAHDSLVNFVHPKSAGGVLVEIVE